MYPNLLSQPHIPDAFPPATPDPADGAGHAIRDIAEETGTLVVDLADTAGHIDDIDTSLTRQAKTMAEMMEQVGIIARGNGAVLGLAPGEKATSVNPMRPNSNFDPFMQSFLKQVGVALQLPLELLMKHFEASYSASRAALEMAWSYFNQQRSWFAYRLNQEVYGWAMDEAVASGRLARPGWFADPMVREAYLMAEWIGPRRWSLNPQQEAGADEIDIRLGVKTREQVCIERTGGDIEKKLDQLAKEHERMVDGGLSVVAPEPAAAQQPTAATRFGQTRAAAEAHVVGTGQHELRATGQVVKFPGFLAVYDETLDQKPGEDEDGSPPCPSGQA